MDAHAHRTHFFLRTRDTSASLAHQTRILARLHTRSPPRSRRTQVYSYQQVLEVNIEEQRIIFTTSGFAPNARVAHTPTHAQLPTRACDRVRCAQADYTCPMQTKVRDSTARAHARTVPRPPCHGRRPEQPNEPLTDRPTVRPTARPRRPLARLTHRPPARHLPDQPTDRTCEACDSPDKRPPRLSTASAVVVRSTSCLKSS